ncbi:MAG: hypothetical protein KDJ65_02865 [Anaerolineae bacterium]|nr:hypothetical protein [Anaerolineae bacterium]
MDKLIREIAAEKEHIEKTVLALSKAMSRPEKTIIESAAIATFLHNVYSGIENILKRILKFKGDTIVSSPSSHKDLLDHSVAAGVISQSLSEELDEYRGFRHFFVHAYGFMLDMEQLTPLAENLPAIWAQFETEIGLFLTRED